MDAERARIEAARRRNLELDEQQAACEAEELLASVASEFMAAGGDNKTVSREGKAGSKAARNSNTSVYVTGLTTYMACRQLEAIAGKIGKVRRIKFYKDDRGGLKGDAVVSFHSHAAMLRAVERLNGFELKPGVVITASAADFSKKPSTAASPTADRSDSDQGQRDRQLVSKIDDSQKDPTSPAPAAAAVAASASALDQSDSCLRSAPSRSVVLHHVWDPLAPQESTSFFDDLEEDMRSECAKHGQVEHVHIVADGSVLVRFATPASATQCQKVMDGRWFDGRQIVARVEQVRSEEPDEADSKLEAFLADLDS